MSAWRILFLNAHPLYASCLADGLRQIGCDVTIVDPGSVPRQEQGNMVGEQIDVIRPDIVISIGYVEHYMDARAVFDAISRRRVYHVYWATEDRPFHQKISLPCARFAHAVFSIDLECLPAYRALGIPAEFLPFACNPALHRVYPKENLPVHDLVLIAHNTPAHHTYRARSLINLLQPFMYGDYDLAVWGYRWDKPYARGLTLPPRFYQGVLSYEEAARAPGWANIMLGPQWDAHSRTQASCRTFEILGAAGFLLTADVPGVRHFFENGVHLVTTDGPARTKALVDRYLADAEARGAIAARGRALVYAEHTYLHRARQFPAAIERWR